MSQFTKLRAMPIGRVSGTTGVNIETIRYYERIGLMPAPDRTAGGNRLYDQPAIGRLCFIKRCRELGFSIEEIRSLLRMVDRKDFTCGEVHRMTVDHLAEVRLKIAHLSRLAAVLEAMAASCSRGDVPECPIIDVLTLPEA